LYLFWLLSLMTFFWYQACLKINKSRTYFEMIELVRAQILIRNISTLHPNFVLFHMSEFSMIRAYFSIKIKSQLNCLKSALKVTILIILGWYHYFEKNNTVLNFKIFCKFQRTEYTFLRDWGILSPYQILWSL
jgi:hypothetical protein